MASASGSQSDQSGARRAASSEPETSARAKRPRMLGFEDVASTITSSPSAQAIHSGQSASALAQARASSEAMAARASEPSGPSAVHQASAVSNPSGAAGVARSANASATHWIIEIEEALRDGGGDREALLRTWRERFVEEIKYATSDEVSLADIAWALAQPAPSGQPPPRELVVADLKRALLSRQWPVGLIGAVAHHVTHADVLSRASRLAWFLDNEARLTAPTGPAPHPPRDMSAMWARLRRTPIDGSTAYAGNQICLRELAPVGMELWHPRLSLADALAHVLPPAEAEALETLVGEDTEKILSTPNHPCHDIWQVLLFSRFLRQMKGVEFATRFVLWSHQLHTPTALHSVKGRANRPRRPLMVRTAAGWRVHQIALVHQHGVWRADPARPPQIWVAESAEHALLLWILTLRDRFAWQLEEGEHLEQVLMPLLA